MFLTNKNNESKIFLTAVAMKITGTKHTVRPAATEHVGTWQRWRGEARIFVCFEKEYDTLHNLLNCIFFNEIGVVVDASPQIFFSFLEKRKEHLHSSLIGNKY